MLANEAWKKARAKHGKEESTKKEMGTRAGAVKECLGVEKEKLWWAMRRKI